MGELHRNANILKNRSVETSVNWCIVITGIARRNVHTYNLAQLPAPKLRSAKLL